MRCGSVKKPDQSYELPLVTSYSALASSPNWGLRDITNSVKKDRFLNENWKRVYNITSFTCNFTDYLVLLLKILKYFSRRSQKDQRKTYDKSRSNVLSSEKPLEAILCVRINDIIFNARAINDVWFINRKSHVFEGTLEKLLRSM